MHLVPRKAHNIANTAEKVCSCDSRCLVNDSRPGWGYLLRSKQWYPLWEACWSGRGKYSNHLENLFKTQLSQAPLWFYSIRVSGNRIDNECGSPDNSNMPGNPHFYSGREQALFTMCHSPRRRICKRTRRETTDSQGRGQIVNKAESLCILYT